MSRTAWLPLVFLLSVLALAARHEPWRDELEYWDAARQSRSLAELRDATRYMGQPPAGHLLLYGVTRVTRDPRALQLLNALIATAAVALIATLAPAPLWLRWLAAFGYYPLFEYGTIARYYALSMLLALAFCALWGRSKRLTLPAGLLGAAFALVTFHATIVAIAAALAHAGALLWERRWPAPRELAALALMAAGVVASVLSAIPPSDAAFLRPWDFSFHAGPAFTTATQLWGGWLPLPALSGYPWNSNVLDASPAARAVLGAAAFGLACLALRRHRASLLLLLTGTTGLLAFQYLQLGGFARHQGYLFLVLVMSAWKAAADLERDGAPAVPAWGRAALVCVLAAQLAAGLWMSVLDLRYPFSGDVATADFLRAEGVDSLPLVGYPAVRVFPVAVLLDRPFYAVDRGRWITRAEWGPEPAGPVQADVPAAIERVRRELGATDVVVVTGAPLRQPQRVPGLRRLGCFEAVLMNDAFCAYLAPGP